MPVNWSEYTQESPTVDWSQYRTADEEPTPPTFDAESAAQPVMGDEERQTLEETTAQPWYKEPLGGRTEIPSGTGPVTRGLAAIGRAAGGAIDYATTPQGLAELAATRTPLRPLVLAKWTKDMAEGFKEGIQSIHDSIAAYAGNRIGLAMQRTQGVPVPESVLEQQNELKQNLADSIASTALMGLGTLGAAKGTIHTSRALLPKSLAETGKSIVSDVGDAIRAFRQQAAAEVPVPEAVRQAEAEAPLITTTGAPNAIHAEAAQPIRPVREAPGEGAAEVPVEGAVPKNDVGGGQTSVTGETGQPGVLPVEVPAFAARYNPETLMQRPAWVEPGSKLDQVLGELREKNDPFGGTDIAPIWKTLSPEQRQDLAARGWVVTSVRDPKAVVLKLGGDVPAARKYYGMQAKRAQGEAGQARVLPVDGTAKEAAPDTSAAPSAKGIAASVRNKWTTATDPTFGSEAGFINLDPVIELWQKYSPKVKDAVLELSDIVKDEMNLSKTSDYRRSVLNWSGKMQRSFGEAAAAQKEIQDVVKDPIRRDGITNWIQAGGDPTILGDRLAKTVAWRDPVTGKPHPQSKTLVAGYEAALNLTPQEVAIANDVRNAFDALHTRGTAYDVLNSFKDNYVTQIWDLKRGPTGGGGSRILKNKFRFSKASSFPTYFDGEQAGFVSKTKDISKILPVYLHEMNSVIAARQLVEQMSKGKASDGRPLLAAKGTGVALDNPSGKATLVIPDAMKSDYSDYKTLPNQPALHAWRWATKDAAGNPVFMKADLALHPEAYGRLNAALGRSAIKEWYNSTGSPLSSIPKGIAKGLDFAHSEVKKMMLGVLTPFHQVQEGTHAIGHRVNPFFNNPRIDLVNNPAQMDAANHGLMLLPDRASANQFMEGFKQSKIVSHIPGLGPLADHYSNYLFHEYIPGIKFKTYEAILRRNLEVYSKDVKAGKATVEDVKTLSASQANAAYGHLNYADIGRNPTIQHLMQLGLLAPDFLEARFRFAGQAIKGVGGAKVGREQVIALATLAVAQATLSYAMAQATGGQWDYKDPFSFHVGNRKFTMRSVPEDLVRMGQDPRSFWYARLNPTVGRGALELLTRTDWRGNKVTAGETLKDIASQPIPLALRPLFGTANSPLSGWEQLAGAAGLKISRYSAQSEIRKVAHQWMANSKDPKLRAEEARFQKESFGDSDYKPLREALINNDLGTAKEAYKKLLETKDAGLIARTMNHPRPFSGKASREFEFKRSLSADQKVLYDQAVKEQQELRQKFNRLAQNKPIK